MKVAVLGAAGGIGQPLSLLLKNSLPSGSSLSLYDVAPFTPGVATDLSHIPTDVCVDGFAGDDLPKALEGADIVVIPAGVARKPGMTRDDLFNINASIVANLVKNCAKICPKACICIITNPVNSTVPLAAEVLKAEGVYDKHRLFGVTALDVLRSETFIAEELGVDKDRVEVPVIGGHSGTTILPLLSQVNVKEKSNGFIGSVSAFFGNKSDPKNHTDFVDKMSTIFGNKSIPENRIDELTKRIQNAGTEVVEAKAGAGSATLSMAAAGARFVLKVVNGLNGAGFVSGYAYTEGGSGYASFFAQKLVLGIEGWEKAEPIGALSVYEQKNLGLLLPELEGNINKGVEFATKWIAENK